MTGKPLAHSARPKRGIPAQPFWKHVELVASAAVSNARHAADFWNGNRDAFCADVEAASWFHDCGKLAPENQRVLEQSAKEKLPIRHEDAGAACLLHKKRTRAALLVASHHAGLPSLSEEKKKLLCKPRGMMYRITEAMPHTAQYLDTYLAEYERAQRADLPGATAIATWSGLAHRVALSCLVDADHTDTATHYREAVPKRPAERRWAERTSALDEYVERISIERPGDPRTADRHRVYEHCRNTFQTANVVSCDAAVGAGKTTAVMAYLLRVAEQKRLRHIFVVLPYTNIIQQSVEVYRKALTLPGEDATEVIAEVHHRAEFQSPESREMAALWDAPITVTTAVQFFETLAGNKPARLRKLHELPGSAVFIDEAHAAIPVWMWPQTWLWLKELADEWGCHFVLASGSLAKFWKNPDIITVPEAIPDLLEPEIRQRLTEVEDRRIVVRTKAEPMNCEELSRFVAEKDGPRLVILNTVQSAAVLADAMRRKAFDVLHLSTALAPADRERVIERVRKRLVDKSDEDWTLVATSCVEAGVDFSFRTAIRESCSVASLIQTGGRVNRHGEWISSEVWDVQLQDVMFNQHPAFVAPRQVLWEMLQEGRIGADASAAVTEALRREIVLRDVREKADALRKAEALEEFPQVAELYDVIDSDTRIVVVDPQLVTRLNERERVSWRELLRGSVQVWARKVQDLGIQCLNHHEEVYCWTGAYDPGFLGYMAGVLPLIHGRDTGLYT
jgi:CRISPR-associated endonuclease/helicase Cas3